MFTQLLVAGLAIGSIYALLGLALVLIHKATGVVNFAQGEMAMFTTFIAYVLLQRLQVPLVAAFLIVPVIGAVIGALTERLVVRPIGNTSQVNAVIASIGLFIVFNQGAGWIWGYDPYRFPSLFSSEPVSFAGARVAPNSIGVLALSLAVMAVLFGFFEFTRAGVAMRAASMNPRAAQLMGIDVERAGMFAWALGGAIGAVCGMLIAPTLFLDFEMMSAVLLKAFAGAIIGGFNSTIGVVIGCLLLGVAEVLFGGYVSGAFKDAFAFVAIVLFLMFKPAGLFGHSGIKKV